MVEKMQKCYIMFRLPCDNKHVWSEKGELPAEAINELQQ